MADLINRTRFSSTLENSLLEKFKQLSEQTRIPASKLWDEAVKDLLEKHSKKK